MYEKPLIERLHQVRHRHVDPSSLPYTNPFATAEEIQAAYVTPKSARPAQEQMPPAPQPADLEQFARGHISGIIQPAFEIIQNAKVKGTPLDQRRQSLVSNLVALQQGLADFFSAYMQLRLADLHERHYRKNEECRHAAEAVAQLQEQQGKLESDVRTADRNVSQARASLQAYSSAPLPAYPRQSELKEREQMIVEVQQIVTEAEGVAATSRSALSAVNVRLRQEQAKLAALDAELQRLTTALSRNAVQDPEIGLMTPWYEY